MTESPETQDLAITLGVEEEFFLVDPETRDLVADPDEGIFEACERSGGPHKVVHEFMRSQIETNTRVCGSVADVREALSETRQLVVEAAEAHGARVMAASTHPFASWREQAPTPGERYRRFASTYQESVRRALVGGMHIHAGFGDEDSRIRVMTALRRYLPFLHALSASSPFNGGHDTGFKSFRLTMMGALPRTGLPSPLHSQAEYKRLVAEYLRMDYIGDARELWWDIRPASAFPTIELRICDVCTHLEDAVMHRGALRLASSAGSCGTTVTARCRPSRTPSSYSRIDGSPSATACSPSSATGPRAADGSTSTTMRRRWWRRSRTTPARSAARRRCAARSPS